MIAHFIPVHRFPEQFKRLFEAVYDPSNHYLVHIDKTSRPELDAEIRAFLADYPNSTVLDGRSAPWGSYSLVDAQLRGMARLLEMGADWEFFINLSGQDYLLKSQSEIADVLSRHRGKAFIKVLDQAAMMNTASHGEIASDDMRMIDWVPDGELKLRPRTFTAQDAPDLLARACLFARKFDASVDDEVLDRIDVSLARPRRPEPRPTAPLVSPSIRRPVAADPIVALAS